MGIASKKQTPRSFDSGFSHPKNEKRVLGDPASPAPRPIERNRSARRAPETRGSLLPLLDAWEFECFEEEVLVRSFVTSQLAFVSFVFALRSVEEVSSQVKA
jgi:hypothetical protein